MATPTNTKNDLLVVSTFGQTSEIVSLAKRIKVMVPGGKDLFDYEAQALAQLSLITDCNPFIGEIWYIHEKGPMIGIKGTRRHGNKQIEEAGGKSAYWFPDLKPCSGEEAGYKGDAKDLAAAWKCIITDSVSTKEYQTMFVETLKTLRDAGSPDPVGETKEIVGKKPEWIGYGYSTVSEKTRMGKQAAAMKRAEADALKKRFHIPFGATIAEGDTAAEVGTQDWIEGSARSVQSDEKNTAADSLKEQYDENQPIEIIDVLGDWAVGEAGKFWNIGKPEAAKSIAKKLQGKMDKREFLDWLHNPVSGQSTEQIIKELL